MGRVPEGFHTHPKLAGLLQARASLPKTNKLSHADAEMIAFGTLLLDGTPVRLSGQDSRRGTFTQRHAVLRDEQTGERYTPLNHMRPGQKAHLDAWDSPLSEYSVLGFDYGYSRANPRSLTLWEAQFGDFCNTAQVIIDQYMAASEVKWHRWAGLVLLLPHGYEGQGPEHSSARLERFLQLCAEENMEVVYPSTAAQTFHLLRRQMLRNFRKPLIVLTPKRYLRIETSTIDELSTGAFRHIIDDPAHAGASASQVSQVAYCSGKIYHELHERREAIGRKDVALVRIEQLYPLHLDALREIDARYPKSARRVWVQEEPRNQGAYLYISDCFRTEMGIELPYLGRPASASPATGSERISGEQQQAILAEAVGPPPAPKEAGTPDGHAKAANGAAGAAKTHKPAASAGSKSKR
jgi:2-oxoglutarate dehydrogenase E1 component